MSYNATVKFCYINDTETSHNKYFPEIIDKQTIIVEAPAQDLNTHQYFGLFQSFLRAVGFNEYGIMDGACRIAFNDCNREDDMKKIADEYDLVLAEDFTSRVGEIENQQDDEIAKLKAEIIDLKAKLSRLENPDNPQYTDEEMNAMTAQNEVTAQTLKNAQVVCHDCGDKYGTYSVGCSSTWTGTCGVCGETKGVTEARDYNYLKKGIDELSKC
jgi:hypothetical protein